MADLITCPFCGYRNIHEYGIQLHIEELHTEDSPFAAAESQSTSSIDPPATSNQTHESDQGLLPDDTWVKCTRDGCGEYLALSDVDEHLDHHLAVTLATEEALVLGAEHQTGPLQRNERATRPSSSSGSASQRKLQKRHSGSSKNHHQGGRRTQTLLSRLSISSMSTTRSLHAPRTPGRLGKRELGPHAFESSMPSEVHRALLSEARPRVVNRIGRNGRLVRETIVPNETSGLIGALADLCARDESNEVTYFCHSSVRHVEKLRCDGNFCGYWNIQMLLTYLQQRHQNLGQETPNVIQIQEMIEKAWENGICPYGQVETGGVLNTRKWIGTHEALAFFTQVGVRVDALSFKESDDASGRPTAEDLLDHVEAIFMSGSDNAIHHHTSVITELPPIYFQRLGHSMTIVGLERKNDGSRNLLIFDPSFGTTGQMERLLAKKTIRASLDTILEVYRRSDLSLSRWPEFEIILPHSKPNGDEAS